MSDNSLTILYVSTATAVALVVTSTLLFRFVPEGFWECIEWETLAAAVIAVSAAYAAVWQARKQTKAVEDQVNLMLRIEDTRRNQKQHAALTIIYPYVRDIHRYCKRHKDTWDGLININHRDNFDKIRRHIWSMNKYKPVVYNISDINLEEARPYLQFLILKLQSEYGSYHESINFFVSRLEDEKEKKDEQFDFLDMELNAIYIDFNKTLTAAVELMGPLVTEMLNIRRADDPNHGSPSDIVKKQLRELE